ncbi:MAG: site-specific DNA-methyltransferase [Candidatus Falkowbacteria bacterium]
MANVKKVDLKSQNFTEEFKAELKKKFPQVFSEDKVDCEKLKLALGDEVDTGRERYGMNWPGKANAIRVAQEPSGATLKPDRASSVDFDNTENLFLEGDNLEILKLLQRSYFGKIKMIYIDPPYNTGKEFIYPDKYAEGLETYLQYTGQIDAQGKKFSTNVETDGRYHSKWMNMMWPRLMLARNLLTKDGVVFISIDDHEVDNLKKVCNEVFGEDNFIGQFVINSTPNARDYGHIGKMHEYALFYGKSLLDTTTNLLPEKEKNFKYNDKDGGYNIHPLYNSNVAFTPENRPNLYYPFYLNPNKKIEEDFFEISLEKNTDSVEIYPPKSQKDNVQFVWRWGRNKSAGELNKEIVGYKTGDGEFRIVEKMRHSAKLIRSLMVETDFSSRRGTAEVEALFGRKIFSFPKPLKLLKDIVKISTNEHDIIIDFFSGSATTAHAVMQLNTEDRGSRKYIMTQLQESVDKDTEAGKAGYKNICEIGKERIRRAAKMIQEENKDKLKDEKIDFGFKVYRLDKSNFSAWDGKSTENLQQKLFDHVDHVGVDSKEEDILYELLLKSGYELTAKVEVVILDKKKVYSVVGGELIVCLEKNIDKDLMKAVAERKPAKVICLNNGFKTDADLTNAAQILKAKEIEFRTV